VDKALLAVGTGIANLGQPDPRKQVHTGGSASTLHPLLTAFLKALRNEDDPESRAYPANITIIRAVIDALNTEDAEYGIANAHIIDLVIVAFYWLLRPAEYLDSAAEGRSQAFLFQDIHLTIDGTVYHAPSAPLHDARDVARISYASLTFADQKNAVKGEQVGHRATNDPILCPAKALGRITLRFLAQTAAPETPINHYFNPHPNHRAWYTTPPAHITNALRHAAKSIEDDTGVPFHLVSARSLRPGGATALLCAGIDKDAVQLLGRWKSDAMLRYLRIQAASIAHNYAQQMLDHGSYTFVPAAFQQDGLPQQAPPAVAALLAHDELYD
jgi:hypothetical protein